MLFARNLSKRGPTSAPKRTIHTSATTLSRPMSAFRGESNRMPSSLRRRVMAPVLRKHKARAEKIQEEEHRTETVSFHPPVVTDEILDIHTSKIRVVEQIKTLPIITPLPHPHWPPKPRKSYATPGGVFLGSGRRKRALASAVVRPGTGKITINGKHWMDHFGNVYTRGVALEPIIATEHCNVVDIDIRVQGGGFSGQAYAIRHALANAFIAADPEYRYLMHTTAMSHHDLRIKERKHTGLRKARRPQQWVKR